MSEPIRINKYIRDKGLASRREADELIAVGKVLVNGRQATTGMMVKEGDRVELKNSGVKKQYLAYYKPRGLPTQGFEGEESVIAEWRNKGLFPVGRLDKESEGLLILTNDRLLTAKLIGENSGMEKEYLVRTRENLRGGVEKIFAGGMKTKPLGRLLPAKAEILGRSEIRITLKEGKKHQIRVMLAELGYTVTSLKRLRIGGVLLGKLKPGAVRELKKSELY